jgi:hypothetical protein
VEGPSAETAAADAKRPGRIRRYASAIAVVALFIAAGGVAAGIAAFRSPATSNNLSTLPGQAAVARLITLKAKDLPPTWHVSNSGSLASSYGPGSVLATPAIVHAWAAAHPACAAVLDGVGAAMLSTLGRSAVTARTLATTENPYGGSWQVADIVAVRADSAEASSGLAGLSSVFENPVADDCVAKLWTASLVSALPVGSVVNVFVVQPPIPVLPGNPVVWAMAMSGSAVVHRTLEPFRFEVFTFATGRIEVAFTTSSTSGPLPSKLGSSLLAALATRAERQAS